MVETSKEYCFVAFGGSRQTVLVMAGIMLAVMKFTADFFIHANIAVDVTYDIVAAMQEEIITTSGMVQGAVREYFPAHQVQQNSEEMATTNNMLRGAMREYFPSHKVAKNSNYAYAFVIGGCNPDKPTYKGFLYNILVSAQLLKDQGSQADVVAFFQLSYEYKAADSLPAEDIAALEMMNVHIQYIPPSPHESFYETVMNKFRVLTLTQYRRVILMDGDVMPVSNLDYLFELSDDNKFGPGNSTLRENVVVAGLWEPSNAGFFMLTPGEGEYEKITDIIHVREDKVRDREGIKFDEEEGWGHVIQEGDEWISRRERGRKWDFHFAFSDQGLLYHWTKYVKKSVSIVYRSHVENWSPGPDGAAVKEQTMQRPFLNYSRPIISTTASCMKFMCDFQHFSGIMKPWLRKPPEDMSEETKLSDGNHLWWYYLRKVDSAIGLNLDFDDWKTGQRPALGLYATWRDMNKNIEKSANNVVS